MLSDKLPTSRKSLTYLTRCVCRVHCIKMASGCFLAVFPAAEGKSNAFGGSTTGGVHRTRKDQYAQMFFLQALVFKKRAEVSVQHKPLKERMATNFLDSLHWSIVYVRGRKRCRWEQVWHHERFRCPQQRRRQPRWFRMSFVGLTLKQQDLPKLLQHFPVMWIKMVRTSRT